MAEKLKLEVSDEIAIKIQGMNKWFGSFHVLRDIDLTVNRGERIVVCGPSGSGKGTISKALAIHLGWNYLDSGLIYRCFAYLTMIGTSNIPKAIKEIQHNFDLNKEEILFNGENITSVIRGKEVTMLSS